MTVLLEKTNQEIIEEFLEEVKNNEPYTYSLTLRYNEQEKSLSEEVNVTILGKYTTWNQKLGIAVDAMPFEIKEEELLNLEEDDLLELSNARAWDTNSIQLLPITSVECICSEDVNKALKVIYTTQDDIDISTTVPISLKNSRSIHVETPALPSSENYPQLPIIISGFFFLIVSIILIYSQVKSHHLKKKADDVLGDGKL